MALKDLDPEMQTKLLERIKASRIIKLSPNGRYQDCWYWTGKKDFGYGRIRCGKIHCRINRISAWIFNVNKDILGDKIVEKFNLDSNLCVLHKCDNRSCFNPDHLFLGTHLDNAIDKTNKNRQAKGEMNGNSKLDYQDIVDIRSYWDNNTFSTTELAEIYKVSVSTIQRIIKKKVWKHVEGVSCR